MQVALVAGWLFAAVTLFLSGAWFSSIHRYDECQLVATRAVAVYLCPVGDAPMPARGGERA